MNNATQSYFLTTFGCQMNEHDSEVIEALLAQRGFLSASTPTEADLIIFNTCCVRENADLKVYGRLGELKRLKERNPELIIAVAGCLAQKDGEAMVRRFPHLDLVIGTSRVGRLPLLLDRIQEQRASRGGEGRASGGAAPDPIVDVTSFAAPGGRAASGEADSLPAKRRGRISAWVPISYGCDNFCTFCIVPFVRGKQRSRSPDSVVREAHALVQQGFREICLLGQNVNSYGFDFVGAGGMTTAPGQAGARLQRGARDPFGDLLEAINAIPDLWRIRFTTSHPKYFSHELVERMQKLEKLCEQFHLPLQSGSNRILKKMHREYTYEEYRSLVEKIRSTFPRCSITTDLIVGFPGESREDFQETLRAVEEIRYDQAFMFAYSPRPGTRAASHPDQLSKEEKNNRLYNLIDVENSIVEKKNQEMAGETVEVLVEGPSWKNPSRLQGRTRSNKIVIFEGAEETAGTLQRVTITAGHLWGLEGSKISEISQIPPGAGPPQAGLPKAGPPGAGPPQAEVHQR